MILQSSILSVNWVRFHVFWLVLLLRLARSRFLRERSICSTVDISEAVIVGFSRWVEFKHIAFFIRFLKIWRFVETAAFLCLIFPCMRFSCQNVTLPQEHHVFACVWLFSNQCTYSCRFDPVDTICLFSLNWLQILDFVTKSFIFFIFSPKYRFWYKKFRFCQILIFDMCATSPRHLRDISATSPRQLFDVFACFCSIIHFLNDFCCF